MSKRIERLNKILDIPAELDKSKTKITIVSFNEVLIENYIGVVEYEDFYIKINTHIGNININGFNMNLQQITDEDILVQGIINSIDVERDS